MTDTGVRAVGARIEELLASVTAGPDADTAEELVQLLVDLYGRGLERVLTVLSDHEPKAVDRLVADELVASLLLVHGLHPVDVDTRIQTALDTVRPYLGSHAGGVEYHGVDSDGVAHLKLAGSCNGCASSTLTVKLAIEGAILDAAPEVTAVDVEGVTAPPPATPLLQIGSRPPDTWPTTDTATEPGWITLPELGPPTSRPVTVDVDGARILVCAVRGTLYAYRDACGNCGHSLAGGRLAGPFLACTDCGTRYDVHLAGTSPDQPTLHLDPLPLLADSHGVRVAVPTTVA